MLVIREEQPQDIPAIHRVNAEAFGSELEANLVENLRQQNAFILSLVAVLDGEVVGHILFTQVLIYPQGSDKQEKATPALGLGPMAVLPAYQNQGIGSRMVQEGLKKCRGMGHCMVVVLGHPNFYPRFGFQKASVYGLRFEMDVPDEAFMVTELCEGALKDVIGVVKYHPEFLNV